MGCTGMEQELGVEASVYTSSALPTFGVSLIFCSSALALPYDTTDSLNIAGQADMRKATYGDYHMGHHA